MTFVHIDGQARESIKNDTILVYMAIIWIRFFFFFALDSNLNI